MTFTYDIKNSKKDKRANICLFSCNTILIVVDLFISTFLVAHIYDYCATTTNYVFAVGQFYLANYAFNFFAIWLISYVVDKTNRVWIYRLSLILELGVVLVAIFFGDKIAAIAWLGGLLRGVFESFYYSSYNVLKQEMVSRKSIKSFSIFNQAITKVVNIVVPITLGALISISTYSHIAIYIAAVCVIQIAISFGIKAHRPEGSSLSFKNYNKSLAKNMIAKNIMRYVYLGCFLYGFTTCISVLANICIMFQFGSIFSLGAITSIISAVSLIAVVLIGKFTHAGKRQLLYILLSALPIIGSLLFVVIPNRATLIVFNLLTTAIHAVYASVFDRYRNGNLKELGLYHQITAHQALCEMLFCFTRIISFGIIMLLGLWENMTAFYAALVVFSSFATIILLYLLIYENKYLLIKNLPKEETDILFGNTQTQSNKR